MSFADHEYLPFLALVLAVFQFVPTRLRGSALLLASLVFYLYWEPWHALILGAVIAVDYLCGRGLQDCESAGRRRLLLAVALTVNLGLLATFKYSAFLLGNLDAGLRALGLPGVPIPELELPLGLSFYTFQGLGYVIDVWRRRLRACDDPWQFALYVAFFPQLVAGPIERADALLPQMRALLPLNAERALSGGGLLLWGLFKKWVLADHLRLLIWPHFQSAGEAPPAVLLIAAFAMYVTLYLDFSAYTDLARGSARLFGVELTLNFKLPLAARTTADLAQRWHVSLYTWIRDYAFAPLARGPLSYASIWRNSLFVLGLFGLWHGASWSFVVWGLASGALIAVQHSWRLMRTRAGVRRAPRTRWRAGDWLSWAWTQSSAALFIVLFFSPDLAGAGDYYARLFDLSSFGAALVPSSVWWVATALALLYLGQLAVDRIGFARVEAAWQGLHPLLRLAGVLALAAATVQWRVAEPLPFVYFQF